MDELIAALQNEDSNVRRVAAEALGRLGYPRAVEPLIIALRDEDPHVRRAAAKALGNIGDARAVKFLVMALHDDNRYVRRAAVVALRKIRDPRAAEPLIIALRDEDSYVRQTAAEVLGNIGDARAVEPLIAALRDEEWSVRGAAIKALGEIGDVRALELLVKARPIVSETWRAHALAELSPRLAELGHPREALAAVRMIENEEYRAQVLARVLRSLPESLMPQALAEAQEITLSWRRAQLVADLAPRLAELGHPHEALEAMWTIGDDEHRVEVLMSLIPYLGESLMPQALAAARELKERGKRAQALAALAAHLPEELKGEVLQEALAAAEAIEDGESRSEALAKLKQVLTEVDRYAVTIGDRGRGMAAGRASTVEVRSPPQAFAVAQIEGYDKDVPLVVNQDYRLLTGILSNVPTEFVGVAVELPDVEVVEIDVVVRTTGMEVRPHWMQQVRFFRGRDAGLLEFRLIPRETGQKHISVEFYYQRHWLARIQFEVDVVEALELVPA